VASALAKVQVKCRTHIPHPLADRDGPDPNPPNKAWLYGVFNSISFHKAAIQPYMRGYTGGAWLFSFLSI
jgi:hypothetical protein